MVARQTSTNKKRTNKNRFLTAVLQTKQGRFEGGKILQAQLQNEKKQDVVWTIHSVDGDVEDCKTFSTLERKFTDGPVINGELDFQSKTNSEFFLECAWPSMKDLKKRISVVRILVPSASRQKDPVS